MFAGQGHFLAAVKLLKIGIVALLAVLLAVICGTVGLRIVQL